MNELRIEIDGDRRWFLPGETLSGRVVWRLEDDAEAVELRLFWYTSGKGTEDVEIVDSVRIEAAGKAGERELQLLPARRALLVLRIAHHPVMGAGARRPSRGRDRTRRVRRGAHARSRFGSRASAGRRSATA